MTKLHEDAAAPEQFDVLDDQGVRTGQALPKGEVHARGFRHGDIHVWMTNGADLIQQQRGTETAIMPGEWDVPAGHVSAGELALDAAVRETTEETGKRYPREMFVHIGSMPVDMEIEGWQHPHRTYGEHYAVYDADLRVEDMEIEEGKALGFRAYPVEQFAQDLQTKEGRTLHASHPLGMLQLGLDGLRRVIAENQ